MDYSSRAYIKALVTLGKQVHGSDHSLTSCPKVSDDNMDLGMLSCSPLFLFQSTNLFTDKAVVPISSVDIGAIRRARDTISNDVIVDIINEDSQSEISYRNSLRRQIVDGCSRLRVTLISIDKLMEHFNKSLEKDSASSISQVD